MWVTACGPKCDYVAFMNRNYKKKAFEFLFLTSSCKLYNSNFVTLSSCFCNRQILSVYLASCIIINPVKAIKEIENVCSCLGPFAIDSVLQSWICVITVICWKCSLLFAHRCCAVWIHLIFWICCLFSSCGHVFITLTRVKHLLKDTRLLLWQLLLESSFSREHLMKGMWDVENRFFFFCPSFFCLPQKTAVWSLQCWNNLNCHHEQTNSGLTGPG